tara:strand:- start:51 stop:887 length:837 start_codon:yes stop_codon:yes gene_type:complete
MFGYFSHGLIRKYVIVFGSMFNDLTIQRYNGATRVQTLAVPIAYGPKQKFLVRLETDPNLDREIAISLPRLGFELTGISYDPVRKLNSTQKNSYVFSDKTLLKTQYTPVPYNIDFTLSIMVKNADDGTQILEQILPYFKPEWNIAVNLVPEMNISMDIPTILNSVSLQDAYDGDFMSRRVLMWDLSFTMKGYLYGPISNSGVITRTQVDLYANTASDTPRSSRLVVVPGLLANNAPTTNSAASISRNLIDADDDYGFASNTFFFLDGLKYDPVSGGDI